MAENNEHSSDEEKIYVMITQKQKVYFDELVLILFDVIDKSPGFSPNMQVLDIDLQDFGLWQLSGLVLLSFFSVFDFSIPFK